LDIGGPTQKTIPIDDDMMIGGFILVFVMGTARIEDEDEDEDEKAGAAMGQVA
jgi:hypothetical protein